MGFVLNDCQFYQFKKSSSLIISDIQAVDTGECFADSNLTKYKLQI